MGDLGFDEKGELSLGEYTARITADGELRAVSKDGKVTKSIPKGASTAQKTQFKGLKARLKQMLGRVVRRMEDAMVAGRTWDVARFENVFIKHPIMGMLGTGLVFANQDGDTIRVSQERTLLDAEGNDVALDATWTLRIVHPLELSKADLEKWRVHLEDAEVVQPFPQIHRETFAKGEIEFDKTARIKPGAFISRLREAGWRRGRPEDAGNIFEDWIRMPARGVQLNVGHSGYHVSDNSWVDDIEVHGLSFASTTGEYMKAKDVDPIVFSEAQLAMHKLFGKAKPAKEEKAPTAKATEQKVDASGTKTRAIVNMGRGFPGADLAKSSRAKCMFCNEKIMKDDVRIIIEREIETPRFTGKGPGYMHPACAPKWVEEAALDFDDFVEQVHKNTALAKGDLPAPFDG